MIIFDTRWEGTGGIGRTTAEIRARLFSDGNYLRPHWPASPVSPLDPFARGMQLRMARNAVFYSPGFNPPVSACDRAVFTLHDLIHLSPSGDAGRLKRLYYQRIVRPAVSKCFKVLTVSEYSRRQVLDWSGADPVQVKNVGSGVDPGFFSPIKPWQPGYPYFLYVGARKRHKNLERLIRAYARSLASKEVRLVLTGAPDASLLAQAAQLGVANRIVFAGRIPEESLPTYYRGAVALLFPSTVEGFGLPPIEAMAGGTPALTSNETSMLEVVGDAALKVEVRSTEALSNGIDRIAFDRELRARLHAAGPLQAKLHSWDFVAAKVGSVISELRDSV